MTRTEGVDVIVVGAGLAGAAAALSAAEAGASVRVLEKTPAPGGSTVLSGGFLAFADTELQRARGIRDSADLLEQDILEVGEHCNDRTLVHAYARGQHDLADWLVAHGLVVHDLEHSSGQTVPRSHRCDPSTLVATLLSDARALDVQVTVDCPVTELITEEGSACGVTTDDGDLRAPAVVLGSGGFSRSEALLERYAPGQRRALRIGGAGNTGDGLTMALSAGADACDFEFVKGTFGTHPETAPDQHELLLLYYAGAIIVNRDGRRYVDESISYKLLGDACLAQDDVVSFQVFDETVFSACRPGVPLFDPRPYLDRGLVLRSDTVDGLAEQMGVPAEALVDTLGDYNRSIDAGDDPFGRTGLVHGSGQLVPLRRPPFYAFPSTSAVLATYCGVRIDADARVLDRARRPLPGLWAAGELTGGFHGAAYMTGTSLGKAAFFGRAAGRNAAAYSRAARFSM